MVLHRRRKMVYNVAIVRKTYELLISYHSKEMNLKIPIMIQLLSTREDPRVNLKNLTPLSTFHPRVLSQLHFQIYNH
jgi:hypothetical protein